MKIAAPRARLAAALVAAVTALPACNDPPPPPAPASSASGASAAVPVPSASAVASAASTGSAAVPQGSNALAGTWSGAYDAKKGEIVQPDGVKDKHWKKDEGKTHVGAGTITLRIAADGMVEGEAKGPLGEQIFEGNTDGKMLGLRVRPKDPLASDGFSGTLVAMVKGNALEGELKCAGPTADIIRHSPIKLEKK